MFRFLIALTFVFFTQSCELLQKRDIDLTEDTNKDTRKFNVLAQVLIDKIAVAESSDPERTIRNYLSSTIAAILVTTKESTLRGLHEAQVGCLPFNSDGSAYQRIRFNLDIGPMVLTSESTGQKYTFQPQKQDQDVIYGAWGWLPPSDYSFEFAQNPSLAWKQSGITALEDGSDIALWSDGAWKQSTRPNLGGDDNYLIRKTEDFRVSFTAPVGAEQASLTLRFGTRNFVKCYGTIGADGRGEVVIPQTVLAQIPANPRAILDLRFIRTRFDTTHTKIDEIYIESSTKHTFGQVPAGDNQFLDFGNVVIAD